MNLLTNMKTAHKLALGFGLCLTFSVIAGLVCLNRMALMIDNTNHIVSGVLARQEAAGQLYGDFAQLHSYQIRLLTYGSQNELALIQSKISGLQQPTGFRFCQLQQTCRYAGRPGQHQAAEAVVRRVQRVRREDDKPGPVEEFVAAKLVNAQECNQAADAIDKQTDTIVKWNHDRGAQLSGDADVAYSNARTTLIGLLLLAIAAGVFSAWWLTRIPSRRLLAKSWDGLRALTRSASTICWGPCRRWRRATGPPPS